MFSSEQILLLIQTAILFATVIVSGYTFYMGHVFTKRNKIQADTNKLFELELERQKIKFQINDISDKLKIIQSEICKQGGNQDEASNNINTLSRHENELYSLLGSIQLEMKHILVATESDYKNFTLSQCRLYADSWDNFLNLDKAMFFWERTLRLNEGNATIKSEILRYYGTFLLKNGLIQDANNRFYESVSLNNNNDYNRFINAYTYKDWIIAYYNFLMNYTIRIEDFETCLTVIKNIVEEYEKVVLSFSSRDKKIQAISDYNYTQRLIERINKFAIESNLSPISTHIYNVR